MDNSPTEQEQLEQAIIALEGQRAVLGDEVVDTALAPMFEKLGELMERQEVTQQRKLATVLFMDIVGSTSMCENLDPEESMDIMDTALQRLAVPVFGYGGRVTRYMGDGFLALFGAPLARENEPEMCVRAGLKILEQADIYAQELKERCEISNFCVRVGIDTGLLIIGGDSEAENTIMGATVNLASRIESAARPGTMLISQNTYQHIRGLFEVKMLDPITAKGFSTPIQTYQVFRARPHTFHSIHQGTEGIQTPMIGRDDELTALQTLLNRTIEDQKTTLVTVLGEAGVGKSRLLYEFEEWLEQQTQEIRFFKGRCSQQRQGMANGLLRDLFAFRFKITESDPIQVVHDKFKKGVSEILREEGELKSQYLGAWLGYDYGQSPHISALREDSEQLHNRASLYLGHFFQALTASSPVAILIEDIHWSDGGSLNAITELCRRYPDLPLFILCIARPRLLTRRPQWGQNLMQASYEQVDLTPLATADSQTLVEAILQKVLEIPPDLIKFIVSRAEGNPYYVEELIQMLVDQQVITTEDDQWQVVPEELVTVQVPDTLTAVLQARLDRLSPDQKKILQQASVVGRVFWDAVLVEMGTRVESQLAELTARKFVQHQLESAFEGTDEFIFKHALQRDVTYESVLIQTRRVYHQLVGRWLTMMARANGRIDEYAAIIGGHYEAAGEIPIAAGWYARAGKRAAEQFDHEAALELLNRALLLTPGEDRISRFEILLAREGIYHLCGEREKQAADLSDLANLVDEMDQSSDLPPGWGARVLLRQAGYAMVISDYQEAITAASGALARAESYGDGKLSAAALARWGDALWRQGNHQNARLRYVDGLVHAESAHAQAELARNLKGLGIVEYEHGNYELAQGHYEAALEIFQKINDQRGESACLSNLGLVAADQGNFTEARQNHQASLEIARAIGDRRSEGIRLNNLGVVTRDQGDFARACEYHQMSLEIYREIGYRRGESICLINLGVVAQNIGTLAQAKEYYQSALRIAREISYRVGEGLILHGLGVLARLEGALEQAEEYFQQALALHQELDQPHHVAEDQAGLAGVLLGRDETPAAREKIVPVLAYLDENPNLDGTMHPYLVYLICSQVLIASGEEDQARQILRTAYDRLVSLSKKLPAPDQQQFWQAREYAALRQLWMVHL